MINEVVVGILITVVYAILFRFVLSDTSLKMTYSESVAKRIYAKALYFFSGTLTLLLICGFVMVIVDIMSRGYLSAIINGWY